jgi:divalent metal cation (Fe/Co/Zn/Cd) transporter
MANSNSLDRRETIEQRRKLERFIVSYKSLEGLVSIMAGLLARSVALTGFGITSLIQVISGTAFLWGLRYDVSYLRRNQVQRRTSRVVGCCLILLGLYVAYESVSMLVQRRAPNKSIPGIIIPFISLDVLRSASEKRQVDSSEVDSDASLEDSFASLPAILLAGLLLHAAFGWWWADPGAAAIMAPILVRVGGRTFGRKGSRSSDSD